MKTLALITLAVISVSLTGCGSSGTASTPVTADIEEQIKKNDALVADAEKANDAAAKQQTKR